MALDLFGIVSNGVYPEDRDGVDDWFGYAVSMGLFTGFSAPTSRLALVMDIVRDIVRDMVRDIVR